MLISKGEPMPAHREEAAMSHQHIVVDDPRPRVRRITLNRPEKRNALNNRLRGEIFEVREAADRDPEISISILRGAGACFSAGYDLSADNKVDQPYHSASGPGQWSRHVVEGWFSIWDLAKPVVAQVHGYCLAGGTELATACDVVYVADDAQIGYPPVRLMSPPDMQYHPWLVGMRRAMELMLTGGRMCGRAPISRLWLSSPRRAATTCRPSGATARASSSSSTSATPRSAITARAR